MGVLIAAGLVGVAALFAFLPSIMKADTRRRRRTDPAYRPIGSLGVIDEVFHPTVYSAFQELEAEQELPAPAPAPGDPLSAASRRRRATRIL